MFIKKETKVVGDWVKTTVEHESCAGKFEVGTDVQIVGEGCRGYDIEDTFGNRMYEVGYTV